MPERKAPQVSIIVPVYNVEGYLRRCLNSILAQTLTDWECVCVDDGSTDGSGAILDEYAAKDARFAVIHQENGGVGTARNVGLDAARADYIGFVDPDDWIESETYEAALNVARRTDADIVQWSFTEEKEGGSFPQGERPEGPFDAALACKTYLFGFPWNKLFRSAFLHKSHIRFIAGLMRKEDFYFSVKAFLLCEKGYFIDRALYHYDRTRPTSLLNTVGKVHLPESPETRKKEYEAMKEIESLLKEKGITEIAGGGTDAFLFVNKFFVKRKLLFSAPRRDYRLFRATFPELNRKMLPFFLKTRKRSAFVMLLAACRMDWAAEAIFWAKGKFYQLRAKP